MAISAFTRIWAGFEEIVSSLLPAESAPRSGRAAVTRHRNRNQTEGTAHGQDRQLGDFAHVDTAYASDLVGRIDAMHELDSFRAYKSADVRSPTACARRQSCRCRLWHRS